MSGSNKKQHKSIILIADDHPSSRRMITHMLDGEGYHFAEAADGKEALDIFLETGADLILMDIVMPVMDGLEACSLIKKSAAGKNVPILMLTASNEGKEMENSYLAGASDFINKPVNSQELRYRVRRLAYMSSLEMEREKAEEEIKRNNLRIRQLSRKVLNAFEEERLRLARELHDEFGMALSTVKLNLQVAKQSISAFNCEESYDFDALIKQIDDVLTQVRGKAAFIRPPSLDALGLVKVVENMVSEISRRAKIKTGLKVNGEPEGLLPEVEITLYRCIQESLTNIVRHSKAKNVLLNITFSDYNITITIIDDGIGFDSNAEDAGKKHLGIRGMEERVELLDGEITIDSKPGRGTNINISVPHNNL